MIKWRWLMPLLLCSAALFGQTKPDFSGVFSCTDAFLGKPIRKHKPPAESLPPLTLLVRQTAERLEVTAIQNWATNTRHYALDGGVSQNVDHNGLQTEDRAEFRDQSLLIETQVDGAKVQKQRWHLSPDQQTLTVTRTFRSEVYSGNRSETFARRPSLEDAMDRAEAMSEMNRCNAVVPPVLLRRPRKYDEGAPLGFTGFQQLGHHVGFYAGFSGLFFHRFARKDKHGVPQFRRKAEIVETYPDSIDLEIWPGASEDAPWELGGAVVPRKYIQPIEMSDLRFHLKWSGTETRDLGEVKSERLTSYWLEQMPREWYLLRVPAKNVPLADNLEIRILSSASQQLGCISGHI
jgi:hypothetical protein